HLSAFQTLDDELGSGTVDSAARKFANAVAASSPCSTPDRILENSLEKVGAFSLLRGIAQDQGPFTLARAATALFGSPANVSAAKGLLRAAVIERKPDPEGRDVAPLPIRVHYFFHNAGRIWACVNPTCTGRKAITPPGRQPPPVGTLYSEPRPRCEY